MHNLFELNEETLMKLPTEQQNLDLAIIHLTFEGIQIYGGGVCTVTRGHLQALSILKKHFEKYNTRITPYFAEIGYEKNHPRRDRKFEEQSTRQIWEMGGDVAYLTNYSWGEEPHTAWGVADLGPVDKWKAACASAATVALNFARRHQAAVIYCHDCVYALAALYSALQSDAFQTDIRAVYVVHSTALTHELPLPNPDRLMAECATIHWGKITPKVKIGYISEFIRKHLIEDYGARLEHTVPTGNGLNPTDPHFRLRSEAEIINKLNEYGIPLDKPLLFSWGRAVAYKRFDMVLKVAEKVKDQLYPVVMVAPHSDELLHLKESLKLDMSLIFKFDSELVACLLQWKNTMVTPILAYLEPCGLTPMEIRMHARNQGPILVTSDTGGLPEQVEDGVDGFISKQDDVENVAGVIKKILALSEADRQRVRQNGLKTILNRYTWTSQILTTLTSLLPALQSRSEKVRQDVIKEVERVLGE